MTRNVKQYEDDDNRVICNMDVPGMRWHDRRVRREKFVAKFVPQNESMTRSEARRFTGYAMLSGLLVVLIFSAVWVLFILFCTQVWFR